VTDAEGLVDRLAEHWRPADITWFADDAYPLVGVPGGEEALEAWRQLYDLRSDLGRYPVLVGTQRDIDIQYDSYSYSESSPAEILAEANAFYARLQDPPTERPSPSVAELHEELRQDVGNAGAWERYGAAAEEEMLVDAFGPLVSYDEWPVVAPAGGITIPFDILTREPHPEVFIALLDVDHPWEVFAHLKFGAFNACPFPSRHVAWWRYWYEHYDPQIVGVTFATVEAWVGEPPATREEALRLAMQQFGYCNDIVYQGVGSVEALAATLLGGVSWYFWWD